MGMTGMKTLFPADDTASSDVSAGQGHVANNLWLAIKKKLKDCLDADAYLTWIDPLVAMAGGADEIVVALPNLVFYQGIHNSYIEPIERCQKELGLEHFRLRLEVAGTDAMGLEMPPGVDHGHDIDGATGGGVAFTSIDEGGEANHAFSRSLSHEGHLNPNYTFDPAIFAESPEARAIGHKLVIPPGPNNPVGVAWIGLDRPGYGMHGTPGPEQVGRTESHGCFRLANWDAAYMVKLAWIHMPVEVVP